MDKKGGVIREFVKFTAILVVSLGVVAYLRYCQGAGSLREVEIDRRVEVDTVVYVDTIAYREPRAVNERVVGRMAISGLRPATGSKRDALEQDSSALMDKGDAFGQDSSALMDEGLPVVQREYGDSTYRAWVSGVDPRLDSIKVYPRREVVTIKYEPKRWHIGPTVGYGITPRGVQPYVGVSVTYSLISF